MTLAEFYGKKLTWGSQLTKLPHNYGMKTQHADLLSFQVRAEADQGFIKKDRKAVRPNRPNRKERPDIRSDNQPRSQEARPNKRA
jgi:hypothetical protein